MGMPVNTVATGGLPIVESTIGFGTPVSEAAPGRGVAVTKVISPAPGLPVIFETIGISSPVVLATLDGTASNATLSNGGLTVTHTNTSQGGARSTAYKTSGKYYFEVTMGTITGDLNGLCISTSAATYVTVSTIGVACFVDTAWYTVANIYSNGSSGNRHTGAIAAGNKVCAAVDMDNKKVWYRVNNNGWQGRTIGLADPASNLDGQTILSSGGHAPVLFFDGANGAANESYTINFGQTAYTYTPPVGFGNWTA